MTVKEISNKIAKSQRLKFALFNDEATELDLTSIFVDFGLAIFEATKSACSRTYGTNRYMNSTDIKKFIKQETPFPININFPIK